MRLDAEILGERNVRLTIVMDRRQWRRVTNGAPTHGQACRLMRERLERVLVPAEEQARILERHDAD